MNRTVLYENHVKLNAKMVDFGGWDMPVQYPAGIIEEHLATRRRAGIFDVSHMGRFIISGEQTLPFLQYVLTNNAAALQPGQAQYTMVPQESGGAVDDAYLYRFFEEEYLLVVNASNREKVWAHFQEQLKAFPKVECTDRTFELAMISLQGPLSREMMLAVLEEGQLPEPSRNNLSVGKLLGEQVLIARTGYTGEPLGFELFVPAASSPRVWDLFIERGASPIGLGARDSLRLEAGLPLYGHELGEDPAGKEIPIFACPLVKVAVSFSPVKGDFIGKPALWKQFEAYRKIVDFDFSDTDELPRMVRSLALLDKGIARAGSEVYADGRMVGWVTSGTMVPYWVAQGDGLENRITDERGKRTVCLALLDSSIGENELLEVEVRGKRLSALTVPYHMRAEAPPYARAAVYDQNYLEEKRRQAAAAGEAAPAEVQTLLAKAVENTVWRQQKCINLIPSEQTQSPLARLLSVMDPSFRYAEHKKVKALNDVDVFYYQGTGFINEVEKLLEIEMCKFLGCAEAETRVISGQMANATVFSAMVDYINRAYRKQEQRRLRSVMNNHIIKGGHLSAQPMGALRDFIARDPETDRPAVINFPVCAENPYKIDMAQVGELLEHYRPELIILGKSMIIHKEPVVEMRKLIDDLSLDCILMYDMAHVLGLIGPLFQEPFKEGADVVTGSTHKTFFGTQRGVVGGNFLELDPRYPFWEAVRRRTFPGAVSNHHLGTMLGLLLAAYEMNHFKDAYQAQVHANAKALAAALHDLGLKVAGDPAVSYTETHQVILNVGYGQGIEAAQRLEESNIIVNYQAAPDEEGFTAAGSLRMGAQEMTRFGMKEKDMATLAGLIKEVLVEGKNAAEEVARFRAGFLQLQYCYNSEDYEEKIAELHRLI